MDGISPSTLLAVNRVIGGVSQREPQPNATTEWRFRIASFDTCVLRGIATFKENGNEKFWAIPAVAAMLLRSVLGLHRLPVRAVSYENCGCNVVTLVVQQHKPL